MSILFFSPKDHGKTSAPPAFLAPAIPADPMINEVYSYWHSLRTNDALPGRAVIDPRHITGALEGIFLLERIGNGLGRLRIAGLNFYDLLGIDAHGMPISSFFEPDDRLHFAKLLETSFSSQEILNLSLNCKTGFGRPSLKARMIFLPLAAEGTQSKLLLGCLSVSGHIGRQPRRLMIEHADRLPPCDVKATAPKRPVAFKETPTSKPYLKLVDL